MKTKLNVYAIYRDEDCVAIGTVPEIARILNIKEKTVRWYITETARRIAKSNPNRLFGFKIED